MKPDQERVKNLLAETVTLLCKNGLTYEEELRIEAVIGVTVDSNDVFLVHINDKFGGTVALKEPESSVSELQAVPSPSLQTEKAALSRKAGDKLSSTDSQGQPSPRLTSSSAPPTPKEESPPTIIKIEDDDTEDEENEMAVTRSPHSFAHQATMVAGKRRVLVRPLHSNPGQSGSPSRQHLRNTEQEQLAQHYGAVESSEQVIKLEAGEPPHKRTAIGDDNPFFAEASYAQSDGQWLSQPDFSNLYQDSGDGQMSHSQPGCSSWPYQAIAPGMQAVSDTVGFFQFHFSKIFKICAAQGRIPPITNK